MGYIIGNIMIIFTTLLILTYAISGLAKNGPQNDGFKPVNTSKMWDMIGFSFYTFEGIGVLMPLMKESANPQKFPKILTAALCTLAVYFSIFGCVSYAYFGNQKESIVINNMNEDDLIIKVTKLLYCINLVFSYPLTIYPANQILENFMFGSLKHSRKTTLRKWLKNLSRFLVVTAGCACSIFLQPILDQFLGISGAVIGIPIILIVPTLCHL